MDAALRQLSDQIDDATQRLLGTARVIPDAELRASSLLPGWTRAHVLAHLARGADAMRNLLTGARAGQDRPAYASAAARESAIEQGSRQGTRELMADLADSAMAFRAIARQLPAAAWKIPVRILGSAPFPAAQLLTRRLVEVELHHCDLGLGYGPADWPTAFTVLELAEPMRSQRQDRLARPTGPGGVAGRDGATGPGGVAGRDGATGPGGVAGPPSRGAGRPPQRPPGPFRPQPWRA